MAFTLSNFAVKRPYLFHLTARANLDVMRQRSAILPASSLFGEAGQSTWLREKRRHHVDIAIGELKIKVRDQAPLHAGNMKLSGGWNFADFIAHLNARVFFWPGKPDAAGIARG
jgi:hypothetical protein